MAEQSLEQRVKDLEESAKSFKHEIERLQAVNDIQNLMSKYGYLHMTFHNKEVIEMYAKKLPDVRVSIKEDGYWEGPDAPHRAWGVNLGDDAKGHVGGIGAHPNTTPMIVVAGDGKTAKGVWIGTGFVAGADPKTGKSHAMWEWDRYGVDFIKEDGKWKFWHFHIYTLFTCGWDDPWEEQFKMKDRPPMKKPPGFEADGPPIDSNPYRPDTVIQLIPVPPEPYETFE